MTDTAVPMPPTLAKVTRDYFRIGCLSFGGPARQIALMHRELVEDRRWVSEDDFLHALNFCHLLPGPEAQQLATWIGWRLHGTRGGVMAAVVCVIGNLTLCFALHVLFGEVGRVGIGGVAIDWPVWSSMDWRAAVLTAASIGALFYARLSVPTTLAIMAAAGWTLAQV